MQVPISSSIAGVVGLGNSRESKSQTTITPAGKSSLIEQAASIEKNSSATDGEAQGHYDGENSKEGHSSQSDSKDSKPTPNLLDLPAEAEQSSSLDLLG